MRWVEGVRAVMVKDLRSEVRARAALNSVVLFAVVTLTMVSYAMGTFGLTPGVHASLLWIIVFFAAMAGLSRTFLVEAERGTALALKLTASGTQVFLGKLMFNLVLLGLLNVILLPLFQILLPIPEANWSLLLVGLVLGNVALASASTLVAAIVAGAGVKGALFTVLAFPILLPVLIGAVSTTHKAMEMLTFGDALGELQLLIGYTGVMITLAVLLFDYAWRD